MEKNEPTGEQKPTKISDYLNTLAAYIQIIESSEVGTGIKTNVDKIVALIKEREVDYTKLQQELQQARKEVEELKERLKAVSSHV